MDIADQPAQTLELDKARQTRARDYARQRLMLRAVSLCLSLAGLAVLGTLHGAVWLRDLAERLTSVWPMQVAIYFGVLGAAAALLELPLTYYSGYVLPHRYRLSTQSLGSWARDLLKGMGVGIVLGGVAIELLYGFLKLTPDTWWIWTGITYTVLTVVLASLAPVLILPLFFKIRPLSDEVLERRIRDLAARAQTRVAAVGEINLSDKSTAANAAVIGLGRTRKIVLGDTLLDHFPADEVEVVVAHELGHHVHRDVFRGLIVGAVLTMGGFAVANLVLHAAVDRLHFAGVWDLATFPILAATLGIWSALTGRIELAHSRRMESAADAFSLSLTKQADAFIRSEVRLTNQNLAWFDPPFWLEALFYTHPAPQRRVEMGRRYAESTAGG